MVIATIQKGAVGTQACTEAINKIQGIVGDLETSAMFATAGALTTEGEAESLSEACHQIVETAKTYVYMCMYISYFCGPKFFENSQ